MFIADKLCCSGLLSVQAPAVGMESQSTAAVKRCALLAVSNGSNNYFAALANPSLGLTVVIKCCQMSKNNAIFLWF